MEKGLDKIIAQEIETERLVLRELNPDILKLLFENFNDDKLIKFLGLGSRKELYIEKEKYKSGYTTWSISYKVWQLIDKETGMVIGRCGFHTWHINHFRAEIGYAITNEAYKRKGFMTEAFGRIIRYGFEEMKLNRIEAFIGPHNIPSLKLVERYGFIKEGQLREHFFKNNTIEDSVVFSLLRKEYCNV